MVAQVSPRPEDPGKSTDTNEVRLQTQIVYRSKEVASLNEIPEATQGPGTFTLSQSVGGVVVNIIYERYEATVQGTATPIITTITSASVGPIISTIPLQQSTGVISTTSQSPETQNSTESTQTASPSSRPTDKGLSSEAAAGVGVGAAIGGILLASLVFFICFRRSRKSQPRYDSEVPLKRTPSYGEGKPASLPQITAIGTWESQAEKLLPQPVADDSISTEMSKLKSMINNHVVSYYRTSEIDLDSIDETALAGIVEDLQISVSQLRSAIVDPQTRTPALRYLIASAIFSRIGLKSHPSTSFLPPEVASCLESMTGLRENDQARTTLLSKWRAITASMLQQTYGSNFITESDPRSYNIGHALEELDSVLVRLRARRDENASRRQNLEEILKRAAGFAFLLFSHPSFWKFEWLADSNHGPGSVVIFPALLQITDENGERLSRPRPFEDMEIARLAT